MITAISMHLNETFLRRQRTLRFFARKGLAKLPFLPVPIGLPLAEGSQLNFWWSYMPESNIAGLPLSAYWSSDRSELQFVWNFLRPGMTFLDIGAYHGIYSIVAAQKLRGEGRIIAFEPSARERRRLALHLHMNGAHVSVEPYAVASEAGIFPFFTVASGFTSMNSLVFPPIQNPVRETKVAAICLDQYLATKEIREVDLIKIDVEGAELAAFRGARRALDSVRPVIICEVLDWVTRPWGYRAGGIVELLSSVGYQWFDFCEDGTLVGHAGKNEYPEVRNYLAVPREKLSQIQAWRRP